ANFGLRHRLMSGSDPHRDSRPLEFTERGDFGSGPVAHCGLMPANLITLPHFSVSSAISLPNVAGGPGSVTLQGSASRVFSLGSASPALIALLRTSTSSAGVLRGAPIPYNEAA